MKLELVPSNDPILRRPTEPFDLENPPYDPAELVNSMGDLMFSLNGLGLAAPQVGIPYSLFVVRGPIAFFNPTIIMLSEETISLEEGCLSYPGMSFMIERPRHCRIRYQDGTGETFTNTYTGMSARCIMHEMDHLNGRVFTDYISKLKLQRAIKSAKKHYHVNYSFSDFHRENDVD
jgi:peptide deformylase